MCLALNLLVSEPAMLAGANVSMAIMFLRSALLLTALLFVLWLCCVVLPFIIWPPPSFSWSIFRSSSAAALVQGYGLDDTFLLYGKFRKSKDARGFLQLMLLKPFKKE